MANLISSPSRFGGAAVEVYYGGQRLYPAPMIDFSRSFSRNDSNVALSTEDTYTLKGLFLTTDNPGYDVVVSGMEDLKTIFAADNLELVIKAGSNAENLPSGSLIASGIFPYVDSIRIPDRTDQFQRFDYEVSLVAVAAASGVSGLVSSSSNSWQFAEEAEGGVTKVTHNISAVGIASGTTTALENAKSFVDSLTGAAALPAGYPSFVIPGDVDGDTATLFEYQRSRSENVDTEAGSYDLTEVFVYVSGVKPYSYTRAYNWEKTTDGIVNVTIAGSVQGYPRSDGTNHEGSAFYNAQSGYFNDVYPSIPVEAQALYDSYGSSGTLNLGKTQAYSIGENRYLGTLTYSLSYTDDPGENLPSGIIEQTVSVQRNEAVSMRQGHTIPQRRLGALFQDIGTPTVGTISIQATAKAENTNDADADINRAIAHIQDLINANRPNPAEFIQIYITTQDQTHDPLQLTASANVAYQYTVDLATVPSANADIVLRPV